MSLRLWCLLGRLEKRTAKRESMGVGKGRVLGRGWIGYNKNSKKVLFKGNAADSPVGVSWPFCWSLAQRYIFGPEVSLH